MGLSGSKPWDNTLPDDLKEKTVLITGANSGLGLEATKRFAEKRATVIMACRSKERAELAIEEVKKSHPDAKVEFMELDLCSFESVKKFAEAYKEKHAKLHYLINNAAVMAIPFERTKDSNETQMQANHFSHFLLTGLLLDRLKESAPARIVNHASSAHGFVKKISFDSWNDEKAYDKWRVYGESKLSNLLFTLELNTRLEKHAPGVVATACHPGWTATNLQLTPGKPVQLTQIANSLFAQNVAVGVQPLLYAAVGSDIERNDYTGPNGWGGMNGPAVKVQPTEYAKDAAMAEALWNLSVSVTGSSDYMKS